MALVQSTPSAPKRTNRTISVDFGSEARYRRLVRSKAATCIAAVVAFLVGVGAVVVHKAGCPGGFHFTRHSIYRRKRLGGMPVCRIQCRECGAVFTVLAHFIMRYRAIRTDQKVLFSLSTRPQNDLLARSNGETPAYGQVQEILAEGKGGRASDHQKRRRANPRADGQEPQTRPKSRASQHNMTKPVRSIWGMVNAAVVRGKGMLLPGGGCQPKLLKREWRNRACEGSR